jgi:hypothetical protein
MHGAGPAAGQLGSGWRSGNFGLEPVFGAARTRLVQSAQRFQICAPGRGPAAHRCAATSQGPAHTVCPRSGGVCPGLAHTLFASAKSIHIYRGGQSSCKLCQLRYYVFIEAASPVESSLDTPGTRESGLGGPGPRLADSRLQSLESDQLGPYLPAQVSDLQIFKSL